VSRRRLTTTRRHWLVSAGAGAMALASAAVWNEAGWWRSIESKDTMQLDRFAVLWFQVAGLGWIALGWLMQHWLQRVAGNRCTCCLCSANLWGLAVHSTGFARRHAARHRAEAGMSSPCN